MYKKLTTDEIEFCECWNDPTAMTECLIPKNFKAPHLWLQEDCEMTRLRPYQFAMQDYSYMYADDLNLSEKENFRNKKGAGDLVNVGARDIGKSWIEIINNFLTLLHGEGDESCIASFDYAHLKKICQPTANLANYHPLFKIYRRKGKECVRFTGGGMEIDTVIGHVQHGKNEKVDSPEPGTAFHSLHYKKFSYEEYSYASTEGTNKRVDSGSSIGHIERLNGIPDIRLGSPLGKVLRDEKKRNWICCLSQFVRSDWDEKTKAEKIEEYGGSTSPMYKLNVLGESIEGAFGLFDMDRIKKKAYTARKRIKFFEVGKEDFYDFQTKIVIDKIPSILTIISSDIGTTGSPSEICIYFDNDNILKWRYNISLFSLTTQEQAKVFKWLYDNLENVIISLDCTSDGGRAIADELEILGVQKEKIVRCMFNTKMTIGFEKDSNGYIQFDTTGKPIHKQERTLDWANQQLEILFYDGKIEIPHSEKFLREFAGYFAVQTGNIKRYGSSTTDHLVQSFQCMALAKFLNDTMELKAPVQEKLFLGGF